MTSRVLCVSTDEAFASRISAPLEYSYPQVSVLTVGSVEQGIEVITEEDVDAVVTDADTAASAPELLDVVRDSGPELSLLVLSTYEADAGRRTAVSEVVDFLEDVGTEEGGNALASWVANSVVDAGRPNGSPPTGSLDSVVSAIKQELVDAERPGNVEDAVCDQLILDDRYQFAWIGELDRGEGQVVPWGTASQGGDWPAARTFPAGDDAEGPVARVLRTQRPLVVDDLQGHPEALPWREVAIDRGCTALAVIPLRTEDDLFGVMGVFSTASDGFESAEREVLRDVADTTARVLEGMAIRGRVDQQERILRRYERLVETVGDGMYALDEGGHFMTVNDALCDMTGFAREGLLGEHIGVVLEEEGIADWDDAVTELAGAAVESRSLELEVVHKDGTVFPCENKIGLLPSDEDGSFRGTVGVLRDITERKQRERELRRQNERLDAFSSIVSHDLRNPLSVAQGYLEVVAESTEDEESIAQVDEALDRMNEMIDDVLALAREGQTATETEPVHLGGLAADAWDTVDTVDASFAVDADLTILADESRVRRLFENLFRNAIQHGGEDVTVSVGTTDVASDRVTLFVEDDGPGMPPDVREHVFESDFTTSEDGHGIGLWVVSEVADAHGWTPVAAVGSEGGARFEFENVQLATDH